MLTAAAVVVGLAGTPAHAGASSDGPMVRQLVTWSGGASGTGGLGALARAVRSAGATVVDDLALAGAVVADAPKQWRAPVGTFAVPDSALRMTASNYATDPQLEPALRETVGARNDADGSGVTVALVDTGVADVPDLAGAVEHVNVSDAELGDGYGHGTFLAGLIASRGVTSDGAARGVAPAAKILDVQVATATGETSLIRVLRGLQAVAERAAQDPSLRVVNLSLSSGSQLPPAADPLSRALEALWDMGLVVVVSAGNDGPTPGSLSSPGTDPVVITAGALDERGTPSRGDDVVAAFSARGRGKGKGAHAKPDLLAPGVRVLGLRAPGSVIDSEHPEGRTGAALFRGSGTSRSAAVTSGGVATLLGEQPDLSPDDVKAALRDGAYDVSGDAAATGAGGLSLPGAAAAATATGTALARPEVAQAWLDFVAAWSEGDRAAAQAAWSELPNWFKHRVAGAWATAVAADGRVDADSVAAARAWVEQFGRGDAWLARAWAARAWAGEDWLARAWAARAWAARAWAARAWAARAWAARAWAARAWAGRAWAARAWAGDEWAARAWAARAWAGQSWSSSSWSADRWSDA